MKRESMVATFSKVNSPQIVSFSLVVAPHGEIEILSGTSKDAAAGFWAKLAMSTNECIYLM